MMGEEVGPYVAAYAASAKKYPNLAAGQPNDQPPHYGIGNSDSDTGVEGIEHKLETIRQQ
jgi:hypothetical protein